MNVWCVLPRDARVTRTWDVETLGRLRNNGHEETGFGTLHERLRSLAEAEAETTRAA